MQDQLAHVALAQRRDARALGLGQHLRRGGICDGREQGIDEGGGEGGLQGGQAHHWIFPGQERRMTDGKAQNTMWGGRFAAGRDE